MARGCAGTRRLIAVVIVAAACGAGTVPAGAAKGKAPAFTDDQVAPLLLAIDDLEQGWAERPVEAPAADPTGGYCNGPDALTRARDVGVAGFASASFIRDRSVGPVIAETVYTFPSTKKAKRFMARTRKTAGSCSTWQRTGTDGRVSDVTLERQEAPGVASDSFTVRQVITPSGSAQGVTKYVTTARAGDVVVVVDHAAVSSVDGALTEAYLDLALTKLEPAIRR